MFSEDYKETPYWWDATPQPDVKAQPLPRHVDVLVVGGGYTGLSAAIQTARAGMDTLVLDAENVGWGCSTRNGGQVSISIKSSYHELSSRYGAEAAFNILQEGHRSLKWTEEFTKTEGIDCNFDIVGRYHAAHNPAQFKKLAASVGKDPKGLEQDAYVVSKSEQDNEILTNAYHGGLVYPKHASIDPAKYHAGLLRLALEAGVAVQSHCPATNITREKSGFLVETSNGVVSAKKVILATNGYSGSLSPWHRRRVIPIGSYVIATEALPKELMDRLLPKDRIISDTRKVVYYYRPSPDRTRVVFGGRVSLAETNPKLSAPKLYKTLVGVFPELESYGVSHSWMGFVAYTFDELMHCGEDDDLYYAMGYCGSGAGMAGYLGMRIGLKAAGSADGQTAFDNIPFEARPFYKENPWFLAPSVLYYKLRDALPI